MMKEARINFKRERFKKILNDEISFIVWKLVKKEILPQISIVKTEWNLTCNEIIVFWDSLTTDITKLKKIVILLEKKKSFIIKLMFASKGLKNLRKMPYILFKHYDNNHDIVKNN